MLVTIRKKVSGMKIMFNNGDRSEMLLNKNKFNANEKINISMLEESIFKKNEIKKTFFDKVFISLRVIKARTEI